MATKYLSLTVLLIGLVAASLGSPVSSGSDDAANMDQLPETDMDGSEFFNSPYRPIGAGFYDYGFQTIPIGPFGPFPGVHPGVLPGVIPQHPFFYHK